MKRSYRQNCALALSSDMLGERWTLLIIRELLIQPCRFKDLNNRLMGMGTNLLTNRLKELEAFGLIERQSQSDKRSPYQLTTRGLATEGIVLAMIRWGNGQLAGEPDFSHQDHWDLLAMKALYNPALFRPSPDSPQTSITLVFKTADFSGWAKTDAKGLSYGLGSYAKTMKEELIIELPMTIKELQQSLIENGKAKKELFNTNPGLETCVNCFALNVK